MSHHPFTTLSRRTVASGLLITAGLLLSACASTGTVPHGAVATSGSLMQGMDILLRQATPSAQVMLRVSPDTVVTGQPIKVEVQSAQSGYVYLFQISTDGRKLDMIFPNALDIANGLQAGSSLELPRPNWRMRTAGPAGVGYLMAVVATEPQDLLALSAAVQRQQLAIKGA